MLKESEAGAKTPELCRRHGVSEQTFYRWKARYGGLEVSTGRSGIRPRQLRRLRQMALALTGGADRLVRRRGGAVAVGFQRPVRLHAPPHGQPTGPSADAFRAERRCGLLACAIFTITG